MENEMTEGLAVTIPTSIAPRYGSPAAQTASSELREEKIEIWIRVIDDGTVDPAGSQVESGHDVNYEGVQPVKKQMVGSLAELAQPSETTDPRPQEQFVWNYQSESRMLRKDFILVLKMYHRERLCSRAVLAPANDSGHAALMVSIRPDDLFGNAVRPQSFEGEIIFVLDQSDSMGWIELGNSQLKIDAMRDAMSLALAGLPPSCMFNILSFGSEVRDMWHESRELDGPGNREQAKKYLACTQANMGGTEVLLALRAAISHRRPSRKSTQVILITDGEVDDEPALLRFVWMTRRELGDGVRFFALGIGDRVSHHVVEKIAELGGGYCDVIDVVTKPRWKERLNRMLRSAMEPDCWTCDISLGPGYVNQTLTDFKFGSDRPQDSSLVPVVQAPHPVPPLHPFSYRSIFFLMDLKSGEPPSKVTLETTTEGARKKTYTLDTTLTRCNTGTLHHLATRAVLGGLQEETKRQGAESDIARWNAEHLGVKYSISSKWTSFVAVAENEKDQHVDLYKSLPKEPDFVALFGEDDDSDDDSGYDLSDSSSSSLSVLPRYLPRYSQGRPMPRFSQGRQMQALVQSPGSDSDRPPTPLPPPPPAPQMPAPQMPDPMPAPMPVPLLSIFPSGTPDDTPIARRKKSMIVPAIQQKKGKKKMSRPMQPAAKMSGQGALCCKRPGPRGCDPEGMPISTRPISTCDIVAADVDAKEEDTDSDKNTSEPHKPCKEPVTADVDAEEVVDSDTDASEPSVQWIRRKVDFDAKEEDTDSEKNTSEPHKPCKEPMAAAVDAEDVIESDTDAGERYMLNSGIASVPRERFMQWNRQKTDSDAEEEDIDLDKDTGETCKPPGKELITSADAVECQRNGGFVLPDALRCRLQRHFCTDTDGRLRRALQDMCPDKEAGLASETLDVLVDTLMMMLYFRTHLAPEEDAWFLLMDNAERSVLLALGLHDDDEGALEPVVETLMGSIAHKHFNEAMVSSSTERPSTEPERPRWPVTRFCSVCGESFGLDAAPHVPQRGFACSHDECFDSDRYTQRVWGSWHEFWQHQMQESHMVCPAPEEGDRDGIGAWQFG